MVQNDGSKVFKISKNICHIYKILYLREISKPQLVQLQQEMKPYIDTELDSVIIFKSRQEKWLDKEFW